MFRVVTPADRDGTSGHGGVADSSGVVSSSDYYRVLASAEYDDGDSDDGAYPCEPSDAGGPCYDDLADDDLGGAATRKRAGAASGAATGVDGGGLAEGKPPRQSAVVRRSDKATAASGAPASGSPSKARSSSAPRTMQSPAVAAAAPAAGFRDMAYQRVGMDGANPFVPGSLAKATSKAAPRTVDNEARVHTDDDRLVFSKKARPVQYK
jgi:hypothetical protein